MRFKASILFAISIYYLKLNRGFDGYSDSLLKLNLKHRTKSVPLKLNTYLITRRWSKAPEYPITKSQSLSYWKPLIGRILKTIASILFAILIYHKLPDG